MLRNILYWLLRKETGHLFYWELIHTGWIVIIFCPSFISNCQHISDTTFMVRFAEVNLNLCFFIIYRFFNLIKRFIKRLELVILWSIFIPQFTFWWQPICKLFLSWYVDIWLSWIFIFVGFYFVFWRTLI